ncbi:hypothetical protein [Agromyces bracchium]|uniref:DUF4352 domain-containing protein n=1 Tax=Agromyces bracchium TaxID=88376 RepID=A0A6I3M133_9MICO|nr:hypothetical protein [Agromyces bracchium]MTH66825.1 hypothetical protein [Agromyces bracchium]
MSGGPLQLALRVDRAPGEDAALVRVTLTVTNTGSDPIAPGVFGSELIVNGESDPSWRLAMNGAVEPELVQLPPERSAELVRDLRVSGLRAGPNEFVGRIGDVQSDPAVLDLP